jgi:hypothetical protein
MLIFRRTESVFYSIWYVTLCERPCNALVESGLESSIPDAVKYNLDLLKLSILLLETCPGI